MRVISFSNFRRNLSAALDWVAADCEPVLVTRGRGKPVAVLVSLEDYASIEETRYLLTSPANAKRLLDSVAEFDGGGADEVLA